MARPRAGPRAPTAPGAARSGRDVSGWGRSPPADWAVEPARGGGRPMGAEPAGARAVICAPGRGAERPRCCRRDTGPGEVRSPALPGPSRRIPRPVPQPPGPVLPRIPLRYSAPTCLSPRSRREVRGARRRAAGPGGETPGFSYFSELGYLLAL